MKNFFISYTKNDKEWATWIAGTLEENGYSTIIQAWDFRPGCNFVAQMDHALSECEKCICVLSQEYTESMFCTAEWTAAFSKDPIGTLGIFIPIRISDVILPPLLSNRVYIDLCEQDEKTATKNLLLGIADSVPRLKPAFPGSITHKSSFPQSAPISLKYLSNYSKDIIYMVISDNASLKQWESMSRHDKRQYIYSRFQPMQFLILGAKRYKGSVCFLVNHDEWQVFATIEMSHNVAISDARIHIFEHGLVCDVDKNAKEFTGHIGM